MKKYHKNQINNWLNHSEIDQESDPDSQRESELEYKFNAYLQLFAVEHGGKIAHISEDSVVERDKG